MSVPTDLDRTFRDRAAAEGILDVAYDLIESPIGSLFLATTDRGVCEIGFDPEPEAEVERLARLHGARVLRSPRSVQDVRRELCLRRAVLLKSRARLLRSVAALAIAAAGEEPD